MEKTRDLLSVESGFVILAAFKGERYRVMHELGLFESEKAAIEAANKSELLRPYFSHRDFIRCFIFSEYRIGDVLINEFPKASAIVRSHREMLQLISGLFFCGLLICLFYGCSA